MSIFTIKICSFSLCIVLKLDGIPQGSHLHFLHPWALCSNCPYSFSMADNPLDSNHLQGQCRRGGMKEGERDWFRAFRQLVLLLKVDQSVGEVKWSGLSNSERGGGGGGERRHICEMLSHARPFTDSSEDCFYDRLAGEGGREQPTPPRTWWPVWMKRPLFINLCPFYLCRRSMASICQSHTKSWFD